MSIPALLAAAPTQPVTREQLLAGYFLIALVGLVVVAIAYVLRVHERWRVVGPIRIPANGELWPLGVGIGTMILCFVGFSLIVGVARGRSQAGEAGRTSATQPASQPTTRAVAPVISPGEMLVLSACLPLASLLVTVVVVSAARRQMLGWLGLSLRRLPVGIGAGLLAAIVAVPLTFIVAIVIEHLYNATGYKHPTEHELLKTMRDVTPTMRWAGLLAAAIAAPLAEEFLFRGLLQTLIREFLVRKWGGRGRVDAAPAMPLFVSPTGEIQMIGARPAQPISAAAPWHGWVAIVVTSHVFASVHELWTAPIIFVLSLGLGYVYERTGNLWSSMTLHAAFNTISTLLFLKGL